jgi:hypothetical protein
MISQNGSSIKNFQQKKSRPSSSATRGMLGRLFLWLFLISVFFIGLGLLSRVLSFQVSLGEYQNIVVTSTEDITKSVTTYLHERFLYPKSNRLWFSNRKMERHIEENFPRVSSVKVSVSKGQFSISGVEREGQYLWCGHEVTAVHLNTPCYFVDQTGFIFDVAPYFSGTSYLRLYGGVVKENIVGSQAFSREMFELYESMRKTLDPFGLKIQALAILPEDQIEFLLVSNNEILKAPRLKYYTSNNKEDILRNITEALRQEKVLLDITSNYDRLEYLDARFKNQIVYKFFDIS